MGHLFLHQLQTVRQLRERRTALTALRVPGNALSSTGSKQLTAAGLCLDCFSCPPSRAFPAPAVQNPAPDGRVKAELGRTRAQARPAPPAAFKYAGGWGEEPSWLPSQSPLPGARGAGPSRLSVQLPLRGGLREAGLRSCALRRSLSAAGGWDEPARGVVLPPSLPPFFLPPSLLPPSFPR